ncbi:chromate transporter [Mediterraneibacter sp. NSJ-151]|uniref:chromate transporter n=1 Tax=Mediterraneibacter sp. NSJ-151 TaxID=2897708 RepID=UPI001F0B207D|nr:chromate transporter [Mediterraneibacter sp. NSJ-151]MCH4279043.1 chromate transporter [Mediterraneibacter sp. NSJ-151]
MIYLQLFFSFLQVGLFSFGGGYAAMPLIQEQIVTKHAWLSMVEFTDLISISQMTPGPIAVNSATFVGNKIAGVGGALIATIGCILPSCIIVTSIAYVYLKNRENQVVQEVLQSLHPAVIAMIASAGISILITAFWGDCGKISVSNTDWSMVVIFAISLFLLRKTCISSILVMILAGGMKLFTSMLL